MFHDSFTDVSVARRPTAGEREVLELLGFLSGAAALVRLSLSDWRRVQDVATALEQARTRPMLPRPRAASEMAMSA